VKADHGLIGLLRLQPVELCFLFLRRGSAALFAVRLFQLEMRARVAWR
jgi:hypothetical protein